MFHKRLSPENGLRGEDFIKDQCEVQNMSSTDMKTATEPVAVRENKRKVVMNHPKSSTIRFKNQEIQAIDEHLESMDHLIQDLFKNGNRANRDLFAMRLATLVRVIRETLNEGVLE
ncbi:hypothetical protein [Sediminispirochaeta smaragdinae]|nr:hypothetical protein [Sediminispirochaeta smaragdinae]